MMQTAPELYFNLNRKLAYRFAAKKAFERWPASAADLSIDVRIPSQDKSSPFITIPSNKLNAVFVSHHFCTSTSKTTPRRPSKRNDGARKCSLCCGTVDALAASSYDEKLTDDICLDIKCMDRLFKQDGPPEFGICCRCHGIKRLVFTEYATDDNEMPATLDILPCLNQWPTTALGGDIHPAAAAAATSLSSSSAIVPRPKPKTTERATCKRAGRRVIGTQTLVTTPPPIPQEIARHDIDIGTETTSEAMQVVESEGDFFLSTPPITLASSSNPAEIGSVTDDNDHTGDTPSNIKKRKRQDEKEPIVANGNDVAKSEEAAAESTSGSAPFVISDDDILMFDQSSSSASKRIKTKESDNDNGNGNQIPTDIGRVQEKAGDAQPIGTIAVQPIPASLPTLPIEEMPADIAGQCLILPASSLPLPIITQDQTAMLAAALANIKLPNLHTDPSATCDEANQLTPPSTLPAAVMVMSSALPTKAKVYPLDALLPESSEAPHSTAQPSPSSSSPLRQGNSQQQQQQQQKNTLRQSAGIPAIFLAPDQAASSSSCGGDGGGGGWIDYGQMHLDHMKGRLRPMNEYKSTTSHSTESCPTPLAENLEQTVTITTTTTTTTTPPTSIENNAEYLEELNSLRALRSKFESYQSEFDKIDAWRKENEKYHSDLARWKEDIMAGQLALSNGTSDLVKRECAHIEAMQQLADEKIAYANKLKADDTALLKKRRELKELEQREKMVDDRAAKAAYDRKCATEDRKIIKAKEEEVKRDLKSISEIASLARQRKEEVAQMLSKAAEIQKTNSSTELRIKEAEAALKRDNDNLKYQKKKQADALAEEKRAWQEKMQKGRMELEEKAQALARDQRKLDDANAARQAERKAKKLRKEAAKLAKTQAKKDRNAKGLMPPPPAAAALHPIANGSARAQTRFDDEDDGGKGRKMLEPAKIVEEEVYDNLDEYHHSN